MARAAQVVPACQPGSEKAPQVVLIITTSLIQMKTSLTARARMKLIAVGTKGLEQWEKLND